MSRVTIKPDSYPYTELISKIEQGLVKIPAFQRDFVWPMDKVLFLLDSIARRYPIGTFLFWQTTDFINSLRNIGNLELDDPQQGYPVQYILDGQQRITSLYAALKTAEINGRVYQVCVDLDSTHESEEIFFACAPDGERYIFVSELLGNDYGDLYVSLKPARRKRFDEIRTTFLSYPFSITLVEGGDLDIVCDLFERINNTGTELSVFDLLVARTWSPPDEAGGFDLRHAFEELKGEFEDVGFEEIPEPIVAQASGAIIKENCKRKAILTIGREEMRKEWPGIAESMRGAIDFVRKKIRVTASRLLPYPSLLVPLSYFFYKNDMKNPDGYQSAWLTRYFYLNGFSNRLSSGTQSKLTEDLRVIDNLVTGKPAKFEQPVSIEAHDIRLTELRIGSAYCKSILCLLAAQRPLDFRDASEVVLQNRALKQANSRHYHHIFPKAYMRGKGGAEEVNSVANVALVPSDLNLKIGSKAPSNYLDKCQQHNTAWEQTLKSHIIIGDARTALQDDEFVHFIEQRASLLSRLAHQVTKLPEQNNT